MPILSRQTFKRAAVSDVLLQLLCAVAVFILPVAAAAAAWDVTLSRRVAGLRSIANKKGGWAGGFVGVFVVVPGGGGGGGGVLAILRLLLYEGLMPAD